MSQGVFVVRVDTRNLFLRAVDPEEIEDRVELPGGFAFGDLALADTFGSPEEAEMFLAQFRASGQLPKLASRCIIAEAA